MSSVQREYLSICFAANHRNHESGEISEVAVPFRPKIVSDDQQIVTAISSVRQLLDHTKQDASKFFGDVESVIRRFLKNMR